MMISAVWRKAIQPLRFETKLGFTCGIVLAATLFGPVSAEPEGAFLSRFDEGGPLPEGWRISNFPVGPSHYRTAWTRNAVIGGRPGEPLALQLYPAPAEAQKDFLGGEVQRVRRTHYGYYEVEMQAGRGDGVISSFFTYTGPYFGDPHDEIDFEFLGRDTTKVWVNRFARGERLPGEWIDLGFDAADGTNIYALDWLPDRIIWYANGNEIHRVEAADRTLPNIPGRIYINIWTGGRAQVDWSGQADPDTKSVATYLCISYRPQGEDAPMCSDRPKAAVPTDE